MIETIVTKLGTNEMEEMDCVVLLKQSKLFGYRGTANDFDLQDTIGTVVIVVSALIMLVILYGGYWVVEVNLF